MSMDITQLRKEYSQGGLTRDNAPDNPFELFKTWFEQAVQAELNEPNAMSLATVSEKGQPNVRTVLLKAYDDNGFVFFTHYKGAKADEIQANNNVALLFPWVSLERQVKIQGRAERTTPDESLKYFLSRPLGSRLGAWASEQSHVISSRRILEMKLEAMKQKFSDGNVPLPDFWGGYRVVPHTFEFWQGRENRLHDRLEFRKTAPDKNWKIQRLAP